jgi:hypothetical protein
LGYRLTGKTWHNNEEGWRTVDGRPTKVEGRGKTIAAMAHTVGVTPEQLRALVIPKEWHNPDNPVHLVAAHHLETVLDTDTDPDPDAYEQWLRDQRQRFSSVGAFLDWVLGVTNDVAQRKET